MSKVTEHRMASKGETVDRITIKVSEQLRKDFPGSYLGEFHNEEPTVVTMSSKSFNEPSITKTLTTLDSTENNTKIAFIVISIILILGLLVTIYFFEPSI